MKVDLRVAVCAILVITPIMGAEQAEFETASVKPADRCIFNNSVDAERVAFNGYPLKSFLSEAFKVKMDQIIGPSWLESDCFTVIAKIPEGATKEQLPVMLQALLVERFKLTAHKESRLRRGYALVVAKNGPKFKESNLNFPSVREHAGQVRFSVGAGPQKGGIKGDMTIASLAHRLSTTLDAPVQDLTGLKGTYDIDLSWGEPDAGNDAAATHSSSADSRAGLPTDATDNIFTSIRDLLGLRLEPHKQQVEVVLIDHIERVPTAN
jgi:uncharacterized protein (TIGR03435 family)